MPGRISCSNGCMWNHWECSTRRLQLLEVFLVKQRVASHVAYEWSTSYYIVGRVGFLRAQHETNLQSSTAFVGVSAGRRMRGRFLTDDVWLRAWNETCTTPRKQTGRQKSGPHSNVRISVHFDELCCSIMGWHLLSAGVGMVWTGDCLPDELDTFARILVDTNVPERRRTAFVRFDLDFGDVV